MRTVTLSDLTVDVPTYVYRLPDAWRVKVPGKPAKTFDDFISPVLAYYDALDYRAQVLPQRRGRGLATRENSNKKRPTGQPGVCVSRSNTQDGWIIVAQAGHPRLGLREQRFLHDDHFDRDLGKLLDWAHARRQVLARRYYRGG